MYRGIQDEIIDMVMNSSNDGINVADENGILVLVNQVSADYAGRTIEEMIGKHVTVFYPKAVMLKVLETRKPLLDKTIHHVRNNRYVVNSYPCVVNGEFAGAFSIFRNIKEIDELNKKIKNLELQLELNAIVEEVPSIIGKEGSLREVIRRARKTVGSLGGPRHSIITGESGTGKTMIANMIYNYARDIGVIHQNAPFIEINCAQFTNSDIAAVEIFGSEEGAYTGSKRKRGLFEQADGGILFLDEAHALEHYQSLLLKVIESGKLRRIGGSKEHRVDVIMIAASTKDLKEELIPELFQRLAQYEIYIPSLKERSLLEKEELLDFFVHRYQEAVKNLQKIDYKVVIPADVKSLLLKASYPRNIRQMRDVVNFSIDSAAPLIDDVDREKEIVTIVGFEDLPFEFLEGDIKKKNDKIDAVAESLIDKYRAEGLGPRKIATKMIEKGYDLAYYQVAYYLSKNQEL